MSLSYLSTYYKINERNTFGAASLRYFSIGDVNFVDDNFQNLGVYVPNELAFDVNYARSFGPEFSLGGSIRFVYSNLYAGRVGLDGQSAAGKALAADISGLYKTNVILFGTDATWSTGLSISNIGTKMSYNLGDRSYFLPASLTLRNINSAAYTGNTTTDKIVVSDDAGVLKTVRSVTASPRFFYLPSMVMPMVNADLPSCASYTGAIFTIDMYAFNNEQFSLAGENASAKSAIKSVGAGSLDVLPANALGYFVTYFDNSVYDPASIALTANGKLSYKILAGATITAKLI